MAEFIKKVAIVGAGGNSGSHMAKSLLEAGKHTVTSITREDSTSKLPEGVIVKKVNFDDPSSISKALEGQDALVITLSVMAPKDQEEKLVRAAADAGVPWVLPNDWSPDSADEGFSRDIVGFQETPKIRTLIKDLGKSSYICVSCGFWYEWSLAIPAAYGIDCLKQEATLFDEGEQPITTSTWPQVGRAVAALLALPVSELEQFRNKNVYVGSFTVSQKDMLESAFRVTGTKKEDWKITNEPAEQRYKDGLAAMKGGDRAGFARQMYTRVFFKDGAGNHEKRHGLSNDLLKLPREDLDEATKAAIKRQKETPHW